MEQNKNIIIMVDDSMTNLAMGKKTLSGQYDVITIASCTELLKILEVVSPDLILLDIEMPDMNGYDVIKAIKGKLETAHIPVIFLTSRVDEYSELEGLSLGAVDYIHKPFSPPLLLKRIEMHLLVEAQKREIKELSEDLFVIIDERTKDLMGMYGEMQRIFADVVNGENIAGDCTVRMQSCQSGEMGKIVEEGDALRFIQKPAAVVRGREQEIKILLREML